MRVGTFQQLDKAKALRAALSAAATAGIAVVLLWPVLSYAGRITNRLNDVKESAARVEVLENAVARERKAIADKLAAFGDETQNLETLTSSDATLAALKEERARFANYIRKAGLTLSIEGEPVETDLTERLSSYSAKLAFTGDRNTVAKLLLQPAANSNLKAISVTHEGEAANALLRVEIEFSRIGARAIEAKQ